MHSFLVGLVPCALLLNPAFVPRIRHATAANNPVGRAPSPEMAFSASTVRAVLGSLAGAGLGVLVTRLDPSTVFAPPALDLPAVSLPAPERAVTSKGGDLAAAKQAAKAAGELQAAKLELPTLGVPAARRLLDSGLTYSGGVGSQVRSALVALARLPSPPKPAQRS